MILAGRNRTRKSALAHSAQSSAYGGPGFQAFDSVAGGTHLACAATMISTRTVLVGVAFIVCGVVACGGSAAPNEFGSSGSSSTSGSSGSPSSSGSSGTTETAPPPEEVVTVAPPKTTLEVTASIISVTLGEDCGGAGLRAGDCAPTPDGKGCGLVCQQSNVQLSFKTGAGKSAKVQILAVTLHDATTGAKVDDLDPSKPQLWTGSVYAAWNETLTPSSDMKTSYDLSAPSWSTIGSGNSYSSKYRLRVSLRIDGVLVTLESTILSREPQVAT